MGLPDANPRNDAERSMSPRAWRRTLNGITDRVVDLMADRPDLSERLAPVIKMITRLREQIERDDFWSGPSLLDRSVSDASTPRAEMAASLLPVHAVTWSRLARESSTKQYVIEDQSLKEITAGPQGESILQVSFDDYVRVAAALERDASSKTGGERAGISARRIMTGTEAEDATPKIPARLVSLTHVYICLRFWQRHDIVARPTRGLFVPAASDRPFTRTAIDAWERLAARD